MHQESIMLMLFIIMAINWLAIKRKARVNLTINFMALMPNLYMKSNILFYAQHSTEIKALIT